MPPRVAVFILPCLLLAGCSYNTFEVVDAVTNRPIEGVQVTRMEWKEVTIHDEFFWAKNVPQLNQIPLGPTAANGTIASFTMCQPFELNGHLFGTIGFNFEKSGYQIASAAVGPYQSSVISAGKQGDNVSSHSTIRIALWPADAHAVPSTMPRVVTTSHSP